MTQKYDAIIIGAGAAGLHCAWQAAARGLRVLLLDHAKQAGKKILISGGGRCNFTNLYASPENYLSENPHFCKSALSRYTQWDFIGLVEKHGIAYHEKTLGQLFCDDSAKAIVRMLLDECDNHGARVQLRTEITSVDYQDELYLVSTSQGNYLAPQLVVACGGLSMPKLGATPFGYQLAEQFGHRILPVRAGLVPFTLHERDKDAYSELSGLALDVTAENARASFKEAMLFTHRGLSGPAMLQISSYWWPGESFSVDLLPQLDSLAELQRLRSERPKLGLRSVLQQWFPKRFAQTVAEQHQWPDKNLADCSNAMLESVANTLHAWPVKPNGTEGYRTAEVTLGGVDTDQLSSKTMASKQQPGLFFIGEVVDVTGWLGGYNFQWAWASAYACAEALTPQ
ncbi:NAD(P)/FAD-dependent oxidoreductase [Pseudidiomarina terrestris]|uniref:NAD(P)/FAD-dependent oxidoreductase n=1 Tax=Pseudidiomarina terrestris TaxID=2820060 RepID=A0AAW7QYG4_9GAMM|nr:MULTISPECIES: NAD(P)/FAD-dependent oxidoreductase [unclassified Pseudidiomarina]MDN7124784.1 NAD(P)/FAD-dependent oxidoreductase [Pseudidiomarina sp. 1APP75-32.1]MDN7125841.1 NAD(P)/FAD-dependent oxidoreductase [Pseudidiomarina sp. 1APR75-33.1]MDN7129742.1 NAD(P)/FAD-dependent oxidoreductase [Pseudidiomarina sp. 1APR75-15]MDN7136473.1 NAD(P)/FAD-dependent oxidoreductase [Pseudidiomarina sp. 1ASP75-5]MDN7138000.1 NAD(P)/FAD-dependent oxidoreductase [Pseudidiomarina sp. 1ASP75-14]